MVFSQSTDWKSNLYMEGNLHYGFITPHLEYISYFIRDHVIGYQFNVGMYTKGEKKWHQQYNYPKIGLGIYHSGLGNDQIYGKMTSVYFYINRYFIKGAPRVNVGNDINFGVGYISKHFNSENNYFDMAIGSKINVFINYNINGTARINDQTYLKLAIGVMHASNGNYQEPNKGLNLITASCGMQYMFNKPNQKDFIKSEIPEDPKKNYFLIMGAFGRKQLGMPLNEKYTPFAISLEYSHEITQTSLLGSSLNFYKDPSIKKLMALNNETISGNDEYRVSWNLSYELKMGKLSYVIQPGLYLKNAYSKAGKISNRIGLRYQLTPKLIAGITIKAHWTAIADFIEWGIGYRLKY
jgi:hypothetical protein